MWVQGIAQQLAEAKYDLPHQWHAFLGHLTLALVQFSCYSQTQAFLLSSCFQFAVCLWNEVFLHYQEGQKGGGRIWDNEHRTLTGQPLHSTRFVLAWKWAADQCWTGQLPAALYCVPCFHQAPYHSSQWRRNGNQKKQGMGSVLFTRQIPMVMQLWIHARKAATFPIVNEPQWFSGHFFLFTKMWLFFPYYDIQWEGKCVCK